MDNSPRIVVTGRGVLTAIGEGPEEFWKALLEGRSGVRPLARTRRSQYRNPLGCEVPLPDPLAPDLADLGRASALMIRAARAAAREAQLSCDAPYRRHRMGVVVGSALLDLRAAEDMLCDQRVDGAFVAGFTMSATLARDLGFTGRHVTFPNACGAGALAIAVAADLIALGELDCVVAVGADTITESMFGFADRTNLRRPKFVAPFDRARAGPILGEGAAALVLERKQRACARGVRIFGEIAGCGVGCDAKSTHAPCEDGVSATIAETLQRARIAPDAVDYVCAHGTATDLNDSVETAALKRVLGDHALRIPVSSIKSMIGHTSGASAAIAVVASLLAIEHGAVPPTMNFVEPGEGLDLNYVPNRPQAWPVNTALVNGFGFGGTNACVVVRRYGTGS